MRIRCARLLPYRLPLRRPWHSRHGILQERKGWLVELITDTGSRGLGDCAPLQAAGTETAAQAQAWLRDYLPRLEQRRPQEALDALPAVFGTPAARCALETALLDLLSQAEDCSLRCRLNPQAVDSIGVNAAAGSLDEGAIGRCQILIERGFRTLKFKVGLCPVEQEHERLQTLDAQLPPPIRLRLDANGAWEADEAARFLADLPQRVESVEEPLAAPQPQNLASLQAVTHAALALDESLPGMPLEALLQNPPVRRLILKPTVLGGLLPAMALARQAARAGLQTLVTSTLESAVGIRAAAQLAAAIPQIEALDHGLGTSDWLAADVAAAPAIVRGRMLLGEVPGLGMDQHQDLSQTIG